MDEVVIKKSNPWLTIWHRYRKNRLAMFGLILLIALILVALFAGVFLDYEQDVVHQDIIHKLQWPSAEHPFGTDKYGRDIMARVIWGARISLSVGFITVFLALFIGAIIGAVAGFYGGKVDNILMRIMDVFLAMPSTMLAIAVVSALGTDMINLLIALAIARIPQFARIVRSAILSVKGMDFVEAARSYGAKDKLIIFKHIIPNAIGPIIVQTTTNLANTILGVAGLSFIGLGIQPPTPEWGSMLSEAKEHMRYYPYLMISPGIAIILAVLAFNLIGDGLRDALDPRLKN